MGNTHSSNRLGTSSSSSMIKELPRSGPGWIRTTPLRPAAPPAAKIKAEPTSTRTRSATRKAAATAAGIDDGVARANRGATEHAEGIEAERVFRNLDRLFQSVPGEVLDMCFNPDRGLQMRDWLSLAGVNTFFRDHLDDDLFCDIYTNSEHNGIPKPKRIRFDRPAHEAFSREMIPWRTAHPVKTIQQDVGPQYYVPPGLRSQWTREQYTRYKKEKGDWAADERHGLDMQREEGEKTYWRESCRTHIISGGRIRKIKEMVPGVKIPVKRLIKDNGAVSKKVTESEGIDSGEWETPDTNGEDDIEPEDPSVCYLNIEDGELKDFWPSSYRTKVADEVNNDWITKTEVGKKFKIPTDQLATIRHAVIPTGNRYKSESHEYQTAAVGALAYRAQSGYEGYLKHVAACTAKALQAANTKYAKAEQARAEGRPVPAPKRRVKRPRAEYRQEISHDDWDPDWGYDVEHGGGGWVPPYPEACQNNGYW